MECAKEMSLRSSRFDVAHHLRFRVVFVELTPRASGTRSDGGTLPQWCSFQGCRRLVCPFRRRCRNGEQYVYCGEVGGFVNAHAHVTVLEVAQVHLLAQGNGAHLLCRYIVGQGEAGVSKYWAFICPVLIY